MSNQETENLNESTDKNVKNKKTKSHGGKYLTFFLADEEYGLEILKVKEINTMIDITHVPRTPKFISGVINLRGSIIPIIELRMKFGMEPVEKTDKTCIIIVQTDNIKMGIVVDMVSEVVYIPDEDIEDSPSFGAGINTDYILGIGKTKDKVKILIDIEKVLTGNEATEINRIAEIKDNDIHE